jgi:hypothetical protein
MINLSGRKYRIWVKQPTDEVGFEVTLACSGDSGGFFVVTDDPIDEDGIFRTRGTLELVPPPGQQDDYDTWERGDLWAIGNVVVVKIADANGILRQHPRSNLRILSKSAPPHPGNNKLTLELADANTWKESVPVDVQQKLSIAQGYQKLGLAFQGSIPAVSENFKSSKNKTQVAIAGERAIAGFSALWQVGNGAIGSKRLNLKPEVRLFRHVVGEDDAGPFEPLQNALRAYSEVQIVNPNLESGDNEESQAEGGGGEDDEPGTSTGLEGGSITVREYVPAEQVKEGAGNSEILAAVRQEYWQWTGNIFTRTITEQRLRGLCVPQELYDQYASTRGGTFYSPSPFAMIPSLRRIERSIYQSKGLLLIRKESEELRPRGQVLGDWHKRNPPKPNQSIPDYTGLVPSERGETTYSFQTGGGKDTGGQVRKIVQEIYRPKGNVAGSAIDWMIENGVGPDPNVMVLSEKNTDTWIKRGKDLWEHRSQRGKAGQVRSGKISAFLALATETTVELSRTGNTQPPAGERKPVEQRAKMPTLKFQIQSPETRIKVVENEFVESQQQGEKVAEIFARISKCREQGFRIYSAWRDELFLYSPFSRIDIKYNGYVYVGITDTVTWTCAANQTLVAIDCMRTGRTAVPRYAPDTYPLPPIALPQPGDPDPAPLPEPAPSNLYPESFVQNIIPVAIPVRECLSNRNSKMVAAHFPIALGKVFPTLTAISDRIREMVVSRQLVSNRSREMVAARTYVAIANRTREMVVSRPIAGLVSRWKFETTAWADEEGANSLTSIGSGSVGLATGYEGNAAQFDGNSYLRSSSPSLDRGTNSFSIAFRLWLPAILGEEFITLYDPIADEYYQENNPLYTTNTLSIVSAAPSQWQITAEGGGYGELFHLRFYCGSANEEAAAIAVSSLNLALDTWHSVEASFDSDNQTISIAVNGVVNSSASDGIESGVFSELRFGVNGGIGVANGDPSLAGTRIDEASFYIYS